jgi:hypothetical protein
LIPSPPTALSQTKLVIAFITICFIARTHKLDIYLGNVLQFFCIPSLTSEIKALLPPTVITWS